MAERNKNTLNGSGEAVWEVNPVAFRLSGQGLTTIELGSHIDSKVAAGLAHRFHNNSYESYKRYFGNERPASAYFFLIGGRVHILWGTVGVNGEAKLHDYLREDPRYQEMKNNPKAIVRSGHIGYIKVPGTNTSARVALMDKVEKKDLPLRPDCPEFFIAQSLLEATTGTILPVTTDGYPMKLVISNTNNIRR